MPLKDSDKPLNVSQEPLLKMQDLMLKKLLPNCTQRMQGILTLELMLSQEKSPT